MAKYSFSDIKKILNDLIDGGGEPELSVYMYGKEYMIIGFINKYSFQRCDSGSGDGSGEFYYSSLDELYNSVTVDNILLKRDWNNITDFDCIDFDWYFGSEVSTNSTSAEDYGEKP